MNIFVKDLNEEKLRARRVETSSWESVRFLLKSDGMGFSFHFTRIHPRADLKMHHRNHLEAVYRISGMGSIEDPQADKVHVLGPGIICALDKHDAQLLCAETELVLACVFVPPLAGSEVHDETGAYPLDLADLISSQRWLISADIESSRSLRRSAVARHARGREAVVSPARAHPQTRKVRRRVNSIDLPWPRCGGPWHGSAARVRRRRTSECERASRTSRREIVAMDGRWCCGFVH
ncbi:ectoine synthase [Mesorhizobium sp. M0910]|uniref:ectoine synthase n=1 Tax=Mesorhizobium sp. M0910 TaxID=2957025 RepID=UPI0033372E36